jgi:methylenetetrahydrofolate dehydrogenase (NADP+)/methenyltetrahydrofolate cyclohydrolase
MTARRIDGKAAAAEIRAAIARSVAAFQHQASRPPGLATVLVGEDSASAVYVRMKGKATTQAVMASFAHHFPDTVSEAELLDLVGELNRDERVDGILIQLPLPGQVDAARVLAAVDPAKDVDGFHPINAGRLAAGLDAVVIGRSNIVGKPMAMLLLGENATVTIAHSKSRDLPGIVRRADIVVAAVGRPEMVRGDWLKPGATVIDVGINRVPDGDGKTRLVGDVAFDEVREVASAITPVPGGVGPMTIACLLANTLTAAKRLSGIA